MNVEAGHMADCPIPAPRRCAGLTTGAQAMVAIGAILSLAALFLDGYGQRLSHSYLWAFSFAWTLALGAMFFVGLQHLVGAMWSIALRRVAEMFAASTWVVAILFIPVLLFCVFHERFGLYPWLDAEYVAGDHILHGKQAYLNLPFFCIRVVFFFALWILFARHFAGNSLKQDIGAKGAEASVTMRKTSAPFMMAFAVTATFAGIDWLMSLAPHWFSTIFGVYVFAGMAVTALATVTIATITLRSHGRLGRGIIGEGHFYNLGALLFGFTCFWAYIAFSQYLLIWYGNLPEESFYLIRRLEGPWLAVSIALACVRFVIPFLALLSRGAKSNARRLVWVSALVIVGQFLDLYWLIMPQTHTDRPVIGWPELGPPLFVVGVLLLYVCVFLKRHLPLAVGDPRFEESQRFYV